MVTLLLINYLHNLALIVTFLGLSQLNLPSLVLNATDVINEFNMITHKSNTRPRHDSEYFIYKLKIHIKYFVVIFI